MEKEILEHHLNINRRKFLSRLGLGIGGVALGSLLVPDLFGSSPEEMVMTGLTTFCTQSKTYHLPVSEWCTITIGPV